MDATAVQTPEEIAVPDVMGDLPSSDYSAIRHGEKTLEDVQAAAKAAAIVEAPPTETEKAASEVLTLEPGDTETAQLSEAARVLGARKGKLHQRVGQILEGERKAKEELAAATKRADDLAAELATLRKTPATEPPLALVAPPVVAVVPPVTDDPKPTQDDFDGSDGKTYEDYNVALARWATRDEHRKIEAKTVETQAATAKRVAQEQADRANETAVAAHVARTEAFRKEHADYDAVVMKDGLAFTHAMVELFITKDPDGPRVAYALAKTPDELQRIAQLTVPEMLVEFGAVKASLKKPQQQAAASSGPAPTAEPVTQHTPPIEPVGSGLSASAVGDPGELSSSDYSKRKDQEYVRSRKR